MRVHYPKRGCKYNSALQVKSGSDVSDAARLSKSPEGRRDCLPAKRKVIVIPNHGIGRGKQDSPHGLKYRDHGKLRTVPFSTKDSIIIFLQCCRD